MQLTASKPVVALPVSAVESVSSVACTEGSGQLILCLVRPMRVMLLMGLCVISNGCVKSADIDPLPPVTRITLGSSELAQDSFAPETARPYDPASGTFSDYPKVDVAAVQSFIDSHRGGWTRAIAVGFGPPSPAWYAHLYDGNRYLGYFAVGAGALPGSAAFFRVRYGDFFAQKRVTAAEANRFLDLTGLGGELAESVDNQVRRQITKRSSATRAAVLVERPAKFQPGDRVRVKLTKVEGVVALRTRFFQEDRYHISAPGTQRVFYPIRENEKRAADYAAWGYSEYHGPSHIEGPFYDSELEPAP